MKPQFQGDPRSMHDLRVYEEEVRAWEEDVQLPQLQKADQGKDVPKNPLAGIFAEALDDKGPKFIEGPTGPGGAPGEDGPAGADGADGPQGPPGNDGADGAQGPPGNDGADGADGADGIDGNDWRVAAGAPSIIAGDEEGDMYLDTSNGDVYQVQSGVWAFVDNITGPTGADGEDAVGSSHTCVYGPPVNQNTSPGIVTVDTDTVRLDQPPEDWNHPGSNGTVRWVGGETITVLIAWSVQMTNVGLGAGFMQVWIETTTPGVFTELVGTRSRTDVQSGDDLNISGTVLTIVNDQNRIRLKATGSASTMQAVADRCRLSIMRIR